MEEGVIVKMDETFIWVDYDIGERVGGCVSNPICCQVMGSDMNKKICPIKLGIDGRDPDQYTVGAMIRFEVPNRPINYKVILSYCISVSVLFVGISVGHLFFNSAKFIILTATLLFILASLACRFWLNVTGEYDQKYNPIIVDRN